MAFYKCGKCNFIFQRKASVDTCPYCEHGYVLTATEADIAEYEKKLNDTEHSNHFIQKVGSSNE